MDESYLEWLSSIPGSDAERARRIAERFPTYESLRGAPREELLAIEGLSPSFVDSLLGLLGNPSDRDARALVSLPGMRVLRRLGRDQVRLLRGRVRKLEGIRTGRPALRFPGGRRHLPNLSDLRRDDGRGIDDLPRVRAPIRRRRARVAAEPTAAPGRGRPFLLPVRGLSLLR